MTDLSNNPMCGQAAPEVPLIVMDFNGDHANDILLMARGGIFAFEQVSRQHSAHDPSAVAEIPIVVVVLVGGGPPGGGGGGIGDRFVACVGCHSGGGAHDCACMCQSHPDW